MKTGIRLFLITVIFAVILGAVDYITRPVIEANEQEARETAMSQVLFGIVNPVFSEEVVTGASRGVTSYFTVYVNGNPAAYVFYVDEKGDQGDITVCVGLNADGVVLGVKLIKHEETPGLGSNAENPAFLSQFNGKTGLFTVVKTYKIAPNDIIAVTAATNTSRAVTAAVNEAVRFFNGNGL
jgi:electron transport complex protein RnfG